jgi:hypothetical protein
MANMMGAGYYGARSKEFNSILTVSWNNFFLDLPQDNNNKLKKARKAQGWPKREC